MYRPVIQIILFDVIYAKQILAQSIIVAQNCALCKVIKARPKTWDVGTQLEKCVGVWILSFYIFSRNNRSNSMEWYKISLWMIIKHKIIYLQNTLMFIHEQFAHKTEIIATVEILCTTMAAKVQMIHNSAMKVATVNCYN